MPVVSGVATYSPNILEELESKANVTRIKAYDEAIKLGNAKVLNIILLGATVEMMELGNIDWDQIIDKEVKPEFASLNKKAFAVGCALVKK